jgi:hypothetical protein
MLNNTIWHPQHRTQKPVGQPRVSSHLTFGTSFDNVPAQSAQAARQGLQVMGLQRCDLFALSIGHARSLISEHNADNPPQFCSTLNPPY